MAAVRVEEGRDYYADLELPFGSDDAEVKKAHRRLGMLPVSNVQIFITVRFNSLPHSSYEIAP